MKKSNVFTILALSALASLASADNLLQDSGFEQSGTAALNPLSSAWTTDLGVRLGPGTGPTDPGSMWDEATYVVAQGVAPNSVHALWRSDISALEGTHYMIVNGATNTSLNVLTSAAPMAVNAGQQYYFQGYAANLNTTQYPDNPAQLTFTVDYYDANNALVNSATGDVLAPSVYVNWRLVGFSSVAGAGAVSAIVRVSNAQVAAGGNDVALDALSFSTQSLPSVPGPSSAATLGLSALGVLRRRRSSARRSDRKK